MSRIERDFEDFKEKGYDQQLEKINKLSDLFFMIATFSFLFGIAILFFMLVFGVPFKIILVCIILLFLIIFFGISIGNKMCSRSEKLQIEKGVQLHKLFDFDKLDKYYKYLFNKFCYTSEKSYKITINVHCIGEDAPYINRMHNRLERDIYDISVSFNTDKNTINYSYFYPSGMLEKNNNKEEIIDSIVKDLAVRLGVNVSCGFIGDYKKHVKDKIEKELLPELISIETKKSIKYIFENIESKVFINCEPIIILYLLKKVKASKGLYLSYASFSENDFLKNSIKTCFFNDFKLVKKNSHFECYNEFYENLDIIHKVFIESITQEMILMANKYKMELDDKIRKSEEEERRFKQYQRSNSSSFKGNHGYHNHCWNCLSEIDSSKNRQCGTCQWYICNRCGACSPNCYK